LTSPASPLGFAGAIDRDIRAARGLQEQALLLERLLGMGVAVFGDDNLIFIRQRLDTVNGLKIEIFPREHPPPHFHVSGNGVDATFTITDCTPVAGELQAKDLALVRWWHKRARQDLINTWNSTRPADCPVGPILE
jgi:hypothetical protein